MSTQRTNTRWALALGAIITGLAVLGHGAPGEADEPRRQLLVYCEGVAVFEAEKARGVPLENRVGHYDWDDRIDVAEQCPGMRPARPALPAGAYQLVQF
ncbi:hypothetical protein [Vreelandella sp. EE22]